MASLRRDFPHFSSPPFSESCLVSSIRMRNRRPFKSRRKSHVDAWQKRAAHTESINQSRLFLYYERFCSYEKGSFRCLPKTPDNNKKHQTHLNRSFSYIDVMFVQKSRFSSRRNYRHRPESISSDFCRDLGVFLRVPSSVASYWHDISHTLPSLLNQYPRCLLGRSGTIPSLM